MAEISIKEIIKPAIDEDKFDGQYSDSGSSENDQEDDEEYQQKQEELKKKQQLLAKGKKQQVKKFKPKKQQKIVFNVSDTKYRVVYFVGKKIFKWRLQYEPDQTDWDIMWTDNAVQPEFLGKMSHHQKINHFPGMYCLARKNHLGRNLMKLKKQYPEHYKFFPQTWILPADFNDFKQQFDKKQKGKARTFIVKPEAGCQGKGIFLTRSLDDFNTTDHYVVQRYMHKPYLIDGLKFDLRIYVLLVGCDPLRVYVYEEGLARFSTEAYQPPHKDNLDDLCMHLTNYAINKDNPNFQFNDNEAKLDVGHKRSLTSTYAYFKNKGYDVDTLKEQINDIIIKTLCCGQPILAHEFKASQPDNYLNNMCFELLGFDILIDEKLKPYLIEINHTPSFATDTPLDSLIKKNAVRDALKLMNISLKTRNETVSIRREIMQKRVLTGKKVKLTYEEKQEQINLGQQKRNEYEDKNCGGYNRIYPLREKKKKTEKEQDNQSVQSNSQQENSTTINDSSSANKSELQSSEQKDSNAINKDQQQENKKQEPEPEEDIYLSFMEYASKVYGQSTGANIRRNTKKQTIDPKQIVDQPGQNGKPINQRTKDIEKIYNQKMKINNNLPRTGTGQTNQGSQQPQLQTVNEKQQQQLNAMQRLSKGGSSCRTQQIPNRSDTANTFYNQENQVNQPSYDDLDQQDGEMYQNQQQQFQQQQQQQQQQVQGNGIKEKEFIIKSQQKNSSYTNFTKKSHENIDYIEEQQFQQQQKQQLQQQYNNNQENIENNNANYKIYNNNTANNIIYNQKTEQQRRQQMLNAKKNNLPSQQISVQQQQQQFTLQQQQQQQFKGSHNQKEKSKRQLQQQQYQLHGGYQQQQQFDMGLGGGQYMQNNNNNQRDGGLFVTPKLFDLNMLQKNYGQASGGSTIGGGQAASLGLGIQGMGVGIGGAGGIEAYSSTYNQNADLYRKINNSNTGSNNKKFNYNTGSINPGLQQQQQNYDNYNKNGYLSKKQI